jgi:hypothetical protein
VKASSQRLSGVVAGVVGIVIECDEHKPVAAIAKLRELSGGEMRSEATRGIGKAGLPEDREIEEALDQNNGGAVTH